MDDNTFSEADFTQPTDGATADTSGQVTGQETTDAAAVTSAAPTTQAARPEGPIPFADHKRVLETTRSKYEQELGWAREYQAEQVQQAMQMFQAADTDPVAFLRWFEGLIKNHPEYSKGLQPQEPVQQPQGAPQPDLFTTDGEKVYSAGQAEALVKHYVDQLRSELSGQIEPVSELIANTQREYKAHEAASAQLSEAETWPHFDTHAPEILEALQKDRRLSLEGAYRRIVFPKLRQLERQSVLTELHTKTGASTETPGRTGTVTPKAYKDMDWEEALHATERELTRR